MRTRIVPKTTPKRAERIVEKVAHQFEPDPRVERRLRDLGDEVHDDEDDAVDEDQRLEHRVVALGHRADEDAAHARPVEQRLNRHGAGEQRADEHAEHHHELWQQVADDVAPEDARALEGRARPRTAGMAPS